jgi:hypothetical protein
MVRLASFPDHLKENRLKLSSILSIIRHKDEKVLKDGRFSMKNKVVRLNRLNAKRLRS